MARNTSRVRAVESGAGGSWGWVLGLHLLWMSAGEVGAELLPPAEGGPRQHAPAVGQTRPPEFLSSNGPTGSPSSQTPDRGSNSQSDDCE